MMHRMLRRQVFADDTVPVVTEHRVVKVESAPHTHDFMELVIVLGGSGTHLADAGETVLEPGCALLVRPGDWHGYARCRHLRVANTYVGMDLFRHELGWVLEDAQLIRLVRPALSGHLIGHLGPEPLRRVVDVLDRLAARAPSGGIAGRTARIGDLTTLLGELAALAAPAGTGHDVARTHPAVLATARALEEQYAEAWTLTELADRVHLSTGHLTHLFREAFKVSPKAYQSRLRAERAAALLIETDCTVAEVGRLVGWSDPNYMSRCFRSHLGVSPLRYRERFSPG